MNNDHAFVPVSESNPTALMVGGPSKSFGAVQRFQGIGFEPRDGEVFGLRGDNGAGKSTRINVHQVVDTCARTVALLHNRKVGDVTVAEMTRSDLVGLITRAAVPEDGQAERANRG